MKELGSISTVPRHVAVIMDGNGRWAKARGLPRARGHEEGAKAIGECLCAARDAGVEFLTLYAFSSENWKRPKTEIDSLMLLLERFLDERTQEMLENNVRLLTIGHIEAFPEGCHTRLRRAVEESSKNTGLTVVLALNYSGRVEIADAARRIAEMVRDRLLEPHDISPERFSEFLYTSQIPDPDLLIRTSGEMRISNFLLWQLAYTELHVTPKLWPDFTQADFHAALADYARRNRRFGGIENP